MTQAMFSKAFVGKIAAAGIEACFGPECSVVSHIACPAVWLGA